MASKRILDKKALKGKGVTFANPTLLKMEKDKTFPGRVRVSENRVGWLEEEVDAWIDGLAAERGTVSVPLPAPVVKRRATTTSATPTDPVPLHAGRRE